MDNLELKILIGMHRNIHKIDRETSRIASNHNLTFSQFMVLEALYSKGDMTIGQVRDSILSSIGTITIIINNLVKMDYVERMSHKNDKRICILHLTPKGLDVISKIIPKNTEKIVEFMSVLTQEEKKQLLCLMKKLRGKANEKKNKK